MESAASQSEGHDHQKNGDGGLRLRLRNFWGSDPVVEEDYYASQNIRSTKSYFKSPSTGLSLFTRSWLPLVDSTPRGLVFMIHGYGNDISWTFQSTPIFLAQHGFACFALDLPGHGRSEGLKAFVPDLNTVIEDCIAYFSSIIKQYTYTSNNNNSRCSCCCFLYGESMGGALCLLIHLRLLQHQHQHHHQRGEDPQLQFRGAVLVAPMCKISDRLRPRWPIPGILTLVARFLPTLAIVPTADLIQKSVRVEEKRAIAASNPMRYTGKPRLGTVVELLRATDHLSGRLSDVTIPFLVLHGSADEVTDPEVSRELYDKAKSDDKTIKMYHGMMHSLLFGETQENLKRVRRDILEWLNDRVAAAAPL